MIPNEPQHQLDIEDEFNALSEEYVCVLPKRLEALRKLIETAQCGCADGMRAAKIESHKIRGTACIFGLPQISEVMSDLEETLTLAAEHPDRLAELLQNKANTLLHAAYEALCLTGQLVGNRREEPLSATERGRRSQWSAY
ncbi:MAG TPA: Hpt domain-containing protein [Trichormus sp.]|jgi:hypothetical protein